MSTRKCSIGNSIGKFGSILESKLTVASDARKLFLFHQHYNSIYTRLSRKMVRLLSKKAENLKIEFFLSDPIDSKSQLKHVSFVPELHVLSSLTSE